MEELELGEYCRETFLRCEVTGLKFITLSEEKISPLGIPHSAHRAKILAHSKMLLEAALSKALTRRPLKNLDW
jgi:SAM domain (Sterile alpha motif)